MVEVPADAGVVAAIDPLDACSNSGLSLSPSPLDVNVVDLKAECLRYQARRKWGDLAACEDPLKATQPEIAQNLKLRASLEIGIEKRLDPLEDALSTCCIGTARRGSPKVRGGCSRKTPTNERPARPSRALPPTRICVIRALCESM
jgi:hypothetical protein